MQLSRLEIKGFKSFGDKVTIEFDAGVTGIVGPNGCGKSNIVDAIRWVLGEQSTKSLRSDKMENIIFNGTRNRKPQHMAEVSLTFLNTKNILPTEYTEVTITRRYYRSGESEYLLNGVTCRLKDINNLLIDTGIGPDSYAIIELKMIDELLNDTANNRRELFEEAAGISKFKARKKEAIKKVADTEADLARVEDLLCEIEKNMISLERQAKQAEKYYKAKQEYRQISLQLAKKIIIQQTEAANKIHVQLEAENAQLHQLTHQISATEAQIEQAHLLIEEKEKLLGQHQRALNEHMACIRQRQNQQQLTQQRLEFLNQRASSLEQQLQEEQHRLSILYSRLATLEEEQRKLQQQAAEIASTVEAVNTEYQQAHQNTKAIQQEHSQIAKQVSLAQKEFFELSKLLEIKQARYNSLRLELEKTHAESTGRRFELENLNNHLLDLQDQITDLEHQLSQTQAAENSLEENIAFTRRQAEEIRLEIVHSQRRADALQNEYRLVKSLVDNLEGFPEAVRFLRTRKHFSHKATLLSDVINAAEAFKLCIENYLQPYMSYYVVDTLQQAFEGIQLLSQSGKGKAGFFVMSELLQSQLPVFEKLFIPNAVHALSVVEYDARFTVLVHYLLGNVYILQQETLPQVPPPIVLITQDGKIIKHPYALWGGSVGLFEGKRLGRARNLEKISHQLAEIKQKINHDEERLKALQQCIQQQVSQSQKSQMEHLQSEIAHLKQEAATMRVRREQLEELLNINDLKINDITTHMEALQEETAQLALQKQQQEQQYHQLEGQLSQLSNQLAKASEALQRQQVAFNEYQLQSHQIKNRLEAVEKEIAYRQQDLQTTLHRAQQFKTELEQIHSEIALLRNNAASDSKEIEILHQQKADLEKAVLQAEQEYFAARGQLAEIDKQLRQLHRQREINSQLIQQLSHQLNQVHLQMTGIKERLSVEFDIDLETVLNDSSLDVSQCNEESLRQEQQKHKEQLERIGTINPMALEAYREIKARYDFINEQRNDLLAAKTSLLTTIQETEAVARRQFLEAFEQIRKHFVVVFRSLFSGEDTCDLVLLDPSNPLESDIDIIAKPKGKRPLTINQLSGGEKTLTAIALLFAIYLLRPAPFCIFDEVDAPLDDANTDKFNNIIRKFSTQTQFIIVTHNKRTMAATDVMYGVTMIEEGVSRLVPVDLRQLTA
ncbi:MAG: chromosome segregation protein SMC [Cytophagales bacterium]|nr:chromosome segregation protein SMC [Bernardetiaceae bacterium]MDW8210709.1 chromosome segregation protein SMC [Cytophagales bacterium]